MVRKLVAVTAIAVVVPLLAPVGANAGEVLFAPQYQLNAGVGGYQTGTGAVSYQDSESVSISVRALSYDDAVSDTWGASHLFERHQGSGDGERGLGACTEASCVQNGTSIPFNPNVGDGDHNELSNQNKQEMIQLALPGAGGDPNINWTDFTLSSLDKNSSGNSDDFERGVAFVSAVDYLDMTTDLATILSDSSTTIIDMFTATSNGLYSKSFAANSAKFLYFVGYDWLNQTNPNNDYLLSSVTFEYPVPEPTTLALFGFSLAGLGWMRRRRAA